MPPEEHARKVEAARAARRERDFVVIARTEALIAGLGLDEALRRARAYADAGADAVLVHSKAARLRRARARSPQRWDAAGAARRRADDVSRRRPSRSSAAAGFRLAIFANQPLRAAIVAMRDTLRRMRETGRAGSVEDRIVPLDEVYAWSACPS